MGRHRPRVNARSIANCGMSLVVSEPFELRVEVEGARPPLIERDVATADRA